MSSLGNKQIMAQNIRYYMNKRNITQTEICNTLGFKMPTFSDWVNAKTYPRIDKIELMANYFGISKADLVEERTSKSDTPKIMTFYNQLNDFGKHEAIKRVEELTYLPQYNNSSAHPEINAAHARTDIDIPDDVDTSDDDIMDDENF